MENFIFERKIYFTLKDALRSGCILSDQPLILILHVLHNPWFCFIFD